MTRAVIYCRFSPRRDADTSKSNDTQLADCREECRREGWEIADELADANAEGDDDERPGLWDAIEAVPRGGVLVVSEMHRIARCPIIEDSVIRLLRKKKAEVRAVHGHGAPLAETWQEEMVRGILAVVARAQKKAGAELTAARMRRMQREGIVVGGVPYGKRREGDRLVDDPHEQAVLSAIRWFTTATPTELAGILNGSGYRKRNGKPWDHRTVGRILEREGLARPAAASVE